MEIKTGYLYHIKDEFFDIVNDKTLVSNYEKGHSRPTYFTIRDGNHLWFIPISSKVDKYKKIIESKVQKYGVCKSILVRKIAVKEVAILIQNVFPILERYIDHPHFTNGKPLKFIASLKEEIIDDFKYMLSMKKEGINLFFTDINYIRKIMEEELVTI